MVKEPEQPTGKAIKAELPDDVTMEDFQFVLQQLLDAWRPILQEDLELSKSAEKLIKEADRHPHTCEDEQLLADRLFAPLATEAMALRTLDARAREILGPIDQWNWCLRKIHCCFRFGWLLSRARTFPSAVYYLYRYWLCIRRLFDDSIGNRPLSAEERSDFRRLVANFAAVFKPYLENEARATERAGELAEDATSGKLDCHTGGDAAEAFFEKFLTPVNAELLLGKEAFEKLRQDPRFWFCRCWCICAFRFGWCLGRARTLFDLVRCLIAYFRCLRHCFQPLTCQITKPVGCTDEEVIQNVGGLGVTAVGTATGGFFDHYTLEWRKVEGHPCADDSGWQSTGVAYPGGTSTGSVSMVNGILGWINTTVLPAGSYEMRLCVYSSLPNVARSCCCTQFSLFKVLVWIDHVADAPVKTGPDFGPFNPDAPLLIPATNDVASVGCCVTVSGSAFVGDCNNRKIKCFELRAAVGFLPGPGQIGFNPAAYSTLLSGPVCYTDPDPQIEAGKRAQWNQVIGKPLTTNLVDNIDIQLGNITIEDLWKLKPFCWSSDTGLPTNVMDGPCPDSRHRCRSGKYTLLLHVTDTLGNDYYDTQHVWFDNKPLTVEFAGLAGLPGCTDLHIGLDTQYVPPGAPCNVPWPVGLLGIAYDEYIDESDLNPPSDNFDYYILRITRQGGPTVQIPITPDLINYGPDPFKGTQRVGDPGTRCDPMPVVAGCPPSPPIPPKFDGILTLLDLRIFDANCAPSVPPPYMIPAGFPLKRGTCCGYAFQLYARDKTRSNTVSCHEAWTPPWAVCICNDLPAGDNG